MVAAGAVGCNSRCCRVGWPVLDAELAVLPPVLLLNSSLIPIEACGADEGAKYGMANGEEAGAVAAIAASVLVDVNEPS